MSDWLGLVKVKRVGDEVSTCAQAHMAECLVFERVVGGAWILRTGGGGVMRVNEQV